MIKCRTSSVTQREVTIFGLGLRSLPRRIYNWTRLVKYDRKGVFTKIFQDREWGDDESVSGIGSRVAQTANVRRELPRLFKQYEIASVFDAPCGDFAWMKEVVAQSSVLYTGGDIVEGVLQKARINAGELPCTFIFHDIVENDLPAVDLWICRDCLLHLSYRDIFSALNKFANSEVRYLLTSTHVHAEGDKNRNIATGDYRAIFLSLPPFSLPAEPIHQFDDYATPYPTRMVLYDRSQIVTALQKNARFAKL